MSISTNLGVVVIGRNEGERLVRCLRSVQAADVREFVYVDSGSRDASVAHARELGACVVALDLAQPFTAGRARNQGLRALLEKNPTLEFVQFLDGDCELQAGWLDAACATLASRPDVAVVFGRRRERAPAASLYNRLIDMEWNVALGEANACGGDALLRVAAFREVGGFRDSLIAGEEPELCHRLQRRGYKILRIDHEMTLHDAALTQFAQWWRRSVRSGHAYAELAALHGREARAYTRRVLSILFWGMGVPLLVFAGLAVGCLWSLGLLLAYLRPGWGAYTDRRRRRDAAREARHYAVFCVIGKFAEALGVCRWVGNRILQRKPQLIEYKA